MITALIYGSSILAALVCAALVPPIRRLAIARGVIDVPAGRKIHAEPVPLLGGVAIYASVLIVGTAGALLNSQKQLVAILMATSIVAAVGLIDDHRTLSAAAKFAGQIVPALLLLAAALRLRLLEAPFADAVLTILVVLGTTNAVNLLDNMDGLAAGVVAIASAAFAVIGVVAGREDVVLLGSILLGACAGFLPFNFPRARIFMGDAGALTLGFLLGVLAVLSNRDADDATMGMFVVLGLPAIDTSLVVASRLRRRLNPFTTPGTDHVSHRLARLLGGRKEAVMTCWLISALFGIAGTWIVLAGHE